jgi:hypothetical protein
MCAHQPQRSSGKDDEERRERVAEAEQDETLGKDQVQRLARKHLPWSDWLKGEYAQYWYWLLVLAADGFVLMDVSQNFHVKDAIGIFGLVAAFICLAILEYQLFVRIWSRGNFLKDRFGR